MTQIKTDATIAVDFNTPGSVTTSVDRISDDAWAAYRRYLPGDVYDVARARLAAGSPSVMYDARHVLGLDDAAWAVEAASYGEESSRIANEAWESGATAIPE